MRIDHAGVRLLLLLCAVLAAFALLAGGADLALAQSGLLTGAPPPAATTPAPAAPALGSGSVREIRIEGTQRIEPETVRSYLLVQPGDPFNDERIDRSLKALFATGLFADVSLRRDGDTLVVRVQENPIINRVAFEGNRKFDDQALTAELQLKPRTVYTRTKVQSDVRRLLELYRRAGRFAATVEPKVIALDQNRVDLVFEISEGETTGISSINFVGNRHFGESRLKEVLSTKESRWYRFLSTADTYDPDRINFDRELLRKFYIGQGYADFRVVSAVAELTPSRDAFFVTFTIEEGERYHFGKVGLESQIKEVDVATLKPLVTVADGDWYSADEVDRTISRLTDELGNRGFAFVEIRPRVERNREAKTIDVVFDIQEGPRVYVERIDITGNVRTVDGVIRREFRLVEGDAFNTSKLKRSQQRIKNLNFFKKVDIANQPGSAPDRTVITVDVEEQSTGELSLGGGFSTTNGPLGSIQLRERNLLGRGYDARIGFELSARAQQIDLSFTDPYFLDRNLAAGFDIFQLDQKNQLNAVYSQFSLGGALRAGYNLTENLRQTLTYTIRRDRIFDVTSDASFYIKQEQGQRTTSSIGQALIYDRRDSNTDPTEGYIVTLGTDLAGLGGDVRFVRAKLSGAYYYPIKQDWTLAATSEVGAIRGIGQGVRIEDRYFIGGDNLRGFATAGVGPHDVTTGDPLGGNRYVVGSLTLSFPLGLPEEFGITGRVFTDAGTLFGVDEQSFNSAAATSVNNPYTNVNSIRLSSGAGLSWKSPLGPIRVDLGVPLIKEPLDKREFFRVGFGTRF